MLLNSFLPKDHELVDLVSWLTAARSRFERIDSINSSTEQDLALHPAENKVAPRYSIQETVSLSRS